MVFVGVLCSPETIVIFFRRPKKSLVVLSPPDLNRITSKMSQAEQFHAEADHDAHVTVPESMAVASNISHVPFQSTKGVKRNKKLKDSRPVKSCKGVESSGRNIMNHGINDNVSTATSVIPNTSVQDITTTSTATTTTSDNFNAAIAVADSSE